MSFEVPERPGKYYRPEIDGLRAIAVSAVMLYHGELAFATGGYSGVDIFFVISGYLITQIILREKDRQTFSLMRFYERRARRILPALFLVLAVCIPPAFLFFDPAELKGLGASLSASSIFSANFYFWLTGGGYFALAMDRMPLLHLWSLAVEEQFYLIYPVLLLIIWRYARQWLIWVIIAGFFTSLALSEYGSVMMPVANFYLLPARGWELLAGATLAIYEQKKGVSSNSRSALKEFTGLAGLAMLIAPVFLYDETTPFPGIYALPTVIGTLLVLYCARTPIFAKTILGARPLVAVGLISYSAYLWHQPLLAFTSIMSLNALSPVMRSIALIIAFLLAWISWKYVEKPFRRTNFLSTRKIFLLAATCTTGFFFIGAAMWASGGFPNRMSQETVELARMNEQYSARITPCFFPSGSNKKLSDACKLGKNGPIRIAVIGDSHAMAIAPALEPMLQSQNIRATLLVAAGCPPVLVMEQLNSHQSHCPAFTNRALKYIVANPEINTVIMTSRWAYNVERSFYDNGEGGVEIGPQALWSDEASSRIFGTSVKKTVDELLRAGKDIVLIYPVPEPGWDVPRYLAHANLLGVDVSENLSTSQVNFNKRNRRAYQMLNDIGHFSQITRLYPAQKLCNQDIANRCILNKGNKPYYFDDDHLSAEGARYALPELGKIKSERISGR